MNAAEAQRMLDRRGVPRADAQIVPSPFGLTGDAVMRALIAGGFLGDLREVHVHGFSSDLADPPAPLAWRQDPVLSGFNMLTLGILHETLCAGCRRPCASWPTPRSSSRPRIDPESGVPARVGTPDSVQVLTAQEDGSCGTYHFSGVVGTSPAWASPSTAARGRCTTT